MSAHNHDLDPSCPEVTMPDGTVRGACMDQAQIVSTGNERDDRDAWMAGFMVADAMWREQYQGALLDQQDADTAYTMWCADKLADAAVDRCRRDMCNPAPDAPTGRLAHREGCSCGCGDWYGL